jgi:hypothetical protein
MWKRVAIVVGVSTILLLVGGFGYLLVEVDDLRDEIKSVGQANKQSVAFITTLVTSLQPDPDEARGMNSDISDLQGDIQDIKSCLNSLGITPTTFRQDWILARVSGALTCQVT